MTTRNIYIGIIQINIDPPQTTTDRSYNTICNIYNWESLEKYSENVENEHHAFLYQRYNFNDTPLL